MAKAKNQQKPTSDAEEVAFQRLVHMEWIRTWRYAILIALGGAIAILLVLFGIYLPVLAGAGKTTQINVVQAWVVDTQVHIIVGWTVAAGAGIGWGCEAYKKRRLAITASKAIDDLKAEIEKLKALQSPKGN